MSNSKKTDNIKTEDPSIHILSFNLFKGGENNKFYVDVPDIKSLADFNKYYKGSIVTSLDIMHLQTIYPDMVKNIKLNSRKKTEVVKKYCDAIINLRFDMPIRDIIKDKSSYALKQKKKHYVIVQKPDSFSNKVNVNLKALRNIIYNNGLDVVFTHGDQITPVHYVQYKRSASKVKNGECLFIREDLLEQMIAWSHLDLPTPKGKIDLASLKAYEALVCSGLEHQGQQTVTIKSNNILLVNDLLGDTFEAYQSVTYRDGKEIKCDNQWRKVQNTCSDGECLLDESLFPVLNERGMQHGFMLLRQRFFKSAALNTKIVEFYREWFGDQYESAYIEDKFGRDIKVSDIRMIVCPSSLKLLKLSNIWFESEQECYEHWLKKLDEEQGTFGIVKHEKPSPFGRNINQLSYQIINTLPINEDEVMGLLAYDFEYISQLKNDNTEFLKHIGFDDHDKVKDEKNDGDTQDSEENDEISSSRDYIKAMVKLNPEFCRTQLFKDFKHNTIENYRKNMRKGKIKTQCDYAVQFGNPWELLLSTVKKVTAADVVAKGRECYCPRFNVVGKGLAIFRSPHICTGNIMYAVNEWHDEYVWFNLTNNIVLVNAWDNDWFDRTQGSDCDSDALLLVSQKQIVQIAKACDVIPEKSNESACLYSTPVNGISGDKKHRPYSLDSMAAIDYIIAENNIGRVVNVSQLLNSYYWDIKKNQPEETELLQEIYNRISICSSLSQVEIDKAKKMFQNLPVKRVLTSLCKLQDSNGQEVILVSEQKVEKTHFSADETEKIFEIQCEQHGCLKERTDNYNNKYTQIYKSTINSLPDVIKYRTFDHNGKTVDFISKLIKPNFFRYCSTDKNVAFRHFETPMDFLEDNLKYNFPQVLPGHRVKTVDIMDLLCKDNKGKINDAQLKDIYDIIFKLKLQKGEIRAKYSDVSNDPEQRQERDKALNKVDENAKLELTNLKIRPATIYYIFYKIYSKKSKADEWSRKLSNIALTLIGMLYQAQPDLMKSLFISDRNIQDVEQDIAV